MALRPNDVDSGITIFTEDRNAAKPQPKYRPRARIGGELVQNRAVNSSTTPLDSYMVSPANFDHEKLDVYQLELKFLTWVTQFLADISGPLSAQTRELEHEDDDEHEDD